MAIVQEQFNSVSVRTYSDKGVYIHGGIPEQNWVDAIDLIENHMEYTETDIPIPPQEMTEEEYAEVGKILLGVDE